MLAPDEILASDMPIANCGPLWSRLTWPVRITWLHAACIDGGMCILDWGSLGVAERARLMIALGDLNEFSHRAEVP